MSAELHLLECLLNVRDSAVAPNAVVGCHCCLAHGVCVFEGFDGVSVGASGHEQVASVDVD